MHSLIIMNKATTKTTNKQTNKEEKKKGVEGGEEEEKEEDIHRLGSEIVSHTQSDHIDTTTHAQPGYKK